MLYFADKGHFMGKSPPRRIGKILLILSLALVLLIFALFQFGNASSGQVGRFFTYRTLGNQNHAEVFHFQGQAASAIANFDNGLALVGTSGLQVYNRAGELVYFANATLANPVLQVNGTRVLAYDLGGFDILIGDRRELTHHLTAQGRIIDARLNANGWLTLSMEQIGTLGVIHVIDPNGDLRYRVEAGLGHGHIIAAGLADNDRNLVSLSMPQQTTHVFMYDITQDGVQDSFYQNDTLFFDFWFTNRNGSVALLSDSNVTHLSQTANLQASYFFEGRHLRGFDTDLGRGILYLGQGQVGTRGEIILFETNGATQHLPVLGTLLDISLQGRFIATLFAEDVILYRNMREYAQLDRLQNEHGILARDDGSIITFSTSRAQIRLP